MAYFDIEEIKFKIKKGGMTMKSSRRGSIGFKRPTSEYEANKMAEEWILDHYPGYEIVDLEIEFK